jgi:hypothetical protein
MARATILRQLDKGDSAAVSRAAGRHPADAGLSEALRAVRDRPTVTIEIACRVLGCSAWAGYQAVRSNTFPVPVLKIGARRLVVPSIALRRVLGLDELPPEPAA